jgi:hypothetical protein
MNQIEVLTSGKNNEYIINMVDLSGNQLTSESDYQGWFKLSLRGIDESSVDILDIKINDQSVGYVLYTGFGITDSGEHLQPCTIFKKNLKFCIWLHTNLGELFHSLYSQIRNGDYGTNLFSKYLFTVDRAVTLDHSYPESIRTFFARATGPRWWHRDSDHLPYKVLDTEINQKLYSSITKLEHHMQTECLDGKPYVRKIKGVNCNWRQLNSPVLTYEADAMSMESIPVAYLQSLLYEIGYRKILSYSILELDPKSYIDIHVDDHYASKNYKYIVGAKKFYVSFNIQDKIYFKLGNAGMLPLNKPLLINTLTHVHSVVNDSNQIRKAFMVYGIMKQDI